MLDFLIVLIVLSSISLGITKQAHRSDHYPTTVPKYETRVDVHTKKSVVSGLVHTLPARSTLAEFRRHLQCATVDPNLNYNNGIVSRMRLVPPNSTHVKSFCSFVERRCHENWADCISKIEAYEKGDYNHREVFNAVGGWSIAELLRVINGTLHYDWPWGIDRLKKKCPDNPLAPLINATLSRISDMRDSAFFTGGADPGLRWYVSVPYFAHCTHENYADIIAPWFNEWIVSIADYKKTRKATVHDFSELSYQSQEEGYKSWEHKVPKAALFASAMHHRMFMFEQARLYPDLIDSINFYPITSFEFCPWNPMSTETCDTDRENRVWPTPEAVFEYQKLPSGYAAPLYNVTSPGFVRYHPGAYKYVVVPLGRQSLLSTSARIVHVMFFSGAVIIAPRTPWIFHFQAQMLPWVHYVPITFTGADLAEKVQWLRDHDDLARQIAENGRNFARSWMRLEDFYCYTANWLDVMAEISEMTDLARTKFNPQVFPKNCLPEQYEFPV